MTVASTDVVTSTGTIGLRSTTTTADGDRGQLPIPLLRRHPTSCYVNDVPLPVGAIEPTAMQRTAARELYQFYVALQQSGFTEDQALDLVSNLLVSSSRQPDEPDV